MQCQRCGADIERGERICAACDSAETPTGIKLYLAIAAPYWILVLLFSYSIQDIHQIISGVVMLFAIAHLLSLPGIYRQSQKHLHIAILTYGFWLALGVLGVLVLPLFSAQTLLWFIPIPAFLWYLYRRSPRGGGHSEFEPG